MIKVLQWRCNPNRQLLRKFLEHMGSSDRDQPGEPQRRKRMEAKPHRDCYGASRMFWTYKLAPPGCPYRMVCGYPQMHLDRRC